MGGGATEMKGAACWALSPLRPYFLSLVFLFSLFFYSVTSGIIDHSQQQAGRFLDEDFTILT